jgi:hypothetical protein
MNHCVDIACVVTFTADRQENGSYLVGGILKGMHYVINDWSFEIDNCNERYLSIFITAKLPITCYPSAERMTTRATGSLFVEWKFINDKYASFIILLSCSVNGLMTGQLAYENTYKTKEGNPVALPMLIPKVLTPNIVMTNDLIDATNTLHREHKEIPKVVMDIVPVQDCFVKPVKVLMNIPHNDYLLMKYNQTKTIINL